MSQVKTGTVNVTHNNNGIVGVGTSWLSTVPVGSMFTVQGSNDPYGVGLVVDDTHITLNSLYAGSSQNGLLYDITTSFTPILGFPYAEIGDIDTATISKRFALMVEAYLSGTTIASISAQPKWIKIADSVPYSTFQTGALTNSIAATTLPVRGHIHACNIKHSTAFAGPSISAVSMRLGIAGVLDKYGNAFDVLQAVSGTAYGPTEFYSSESWTATTSLLLTATSVGANLSALNAGAVSVWILASQPPA